MGCLVSEQKTSVFKFPVRIYYEDTDAGGIVYYVNYLKFMERARTEYLRHFGFEQQVLMEQGRMFVVTDCSMEYRRPAKLDDLLQVTVETELKSKVRLQFNQQIYRDDELLCEGRFMIACVHPETLRPVKIPDDLCLSTGKA